MRTRSSSLLTLLLMFVAVGVLWAADVWVAKPYTAWDDKDVLKIMSDSPWARKVSVTFKSVPGGGAAASDGTGGGGDPLDSDLTVRWQTAPTMLQATVRKKFADEAGTNPAAQSELQPDAKYYIIWVAGLPGALSTQDDDAKNALLQVTTLSVKGKDPIVATSLDFPPPEKSSDDGAGFDFPGGRGFPGGGNFPIDPSRICGFLKSGDLDRFDNGGAGGQMAERMRSFCAGLNTDAHFMFPRKFAISADDKEVEFTTKFGKTIVKAKFNLKAMVVNGKLGL